MLLHNVKKHDFCLKFQSFLKYSLPKTEVVLGEAGIFPSLLSSGSVWAVNKMNAGPIQDMGNDAIQTVAWKIPADAQYVKISPDSHTLVVYFYNSNNSYLGRTEFVTTETTTGIIQGAAYACVSLQNCSPAQMAEDNYQVSFLSQFIT